MRPIHFLLPALVTGLLATRAAAAAPIDFPWQVDIEVGRAYPAMIDVRIPGDTGTEFSLTDDLESQDDWVGRIQLTWRLNERHRFLALGAPLTIKSTGQFDEPVDFNGQTFPANTDMESRYQFNSYRLTWRYDADPQGDFRWGIGLTGKIRDAEIALAGGGVESVKKNVGFVPLINFALEARVTKAWWFLIEGDALAAPQGRAEDVFVGARRDFDEQSSIRLGYRILEGGADNDEVYNFSLIHYLVGAVAVQF